MDVARAHQALGDDTRLAIAHALLTRDLSPGEIAEQWQLSSPLVAHHIGTLVDAGLIRRTRGEHDGRKHYLSLRRDDPTVLALVSAGAPGVRPPRRIAFVCTKNSARSKLAAACWRHVSPIPVVDAGTAPANAPHPLTVRTASARGLDVDLTMRDAAATLKADDLVIAVCDHVHETLPPLPRWHWSIPDPVPAATPASFEAAYEALEAHIAALHQALTPTP